MKLPYFYFLRRARKSAKSQAFVEFVLILPWYLALMCGVFDYGWFIGNKTLLVMSVATATQIGSRSEDTMDTTRQTVMQILAQSPLPRLDLSSAKGAGVVTFIIRPGTSDYIRVNGGDPSAAVGSLGLLFGGDIATKEHSHLVYGWDQAHSTNSWTNPERKVPYVSPQDLSQGKVYCNVEAWYIAETVTPFGTIITKSLPPYLYDSYLQFSLQNPS